MAASTLTQPLVSGLVADLTTTTGDTVPVIAPFTGEVLHQLPISSAEDVADAAAAARIAQKSWREAGFAHRRAVLLKAHDLLLERREELLDILQTESGKTRGQAFEEVFQSASVTRYYAVSARGVLRTRHRRSGIPTVVRTRVGYKPKGVIGIITPWNYPIALSIMDVIPALAGGKARPDLGPFFFEPTVLANVTEAMECFAHETFGPVVAITVVDSEEEAIAAANASEFGLNASVFSGSVSRARRVADRLDAGSVNINEGYRASFGSVDAPQGGMKQSGLGRRNGPEGILRYVEARTVAEATGILTLPRTGPEWARLSGVMIAMLKGLKALRRR